MAESKVWVIEVFSSKDKVRAKAYNPDKPFSKREQKVLIRLLEPLIDAWKEK